jgi:hypothetical protein
MKHSINFVDLFDWELESDRHLWEMMNGPHSEEDLREPAKIIVKTKKNANKTNKRAFSGIGKKRIQP